MTVDQKTMLLDKALELGADRAKLIDVDTVVVEEWVLWKCQYGCLLFNKDMLHPPCSPGVESTSKVLSEYKKGILLNSPKEKELSRIALKLEGEAYHRGYYKAFAMIALSSAAEVAAASGDDSAPGAT